MVAQGMLLVQSDHANMKRHLGSIHPILNSKCNSAK